MMAGYGQIGGNVADIHQAASVMTDTGAAAAESGRQAAQFSTQMEGQVGEVTATLATHFTQTADTLRQSIGQTKQRLGVTQWDGASRANAEAAEAQLNSDVNKVLDHALTSVEEFKSFMLSRSRDFASSVDTQFGAVTRNIEASYQDLAKASQTFAENLERADESIKFGGSAQ